MTQKRMDYAGFGARRLTDHLHLLTGCFDTFVFGKQFHTHLSAYLVCGQGKSVLIDTGHTKDAANVAAYVRSVVGDDLTYIFPTHEEYPHAGALASLLEEFPKALVTGETRNFHLYLPDQYTPERFIQSELGDIIDLGGRNLHVLPALMKDLQPSYWAYDDGDQALFVSDGFAFSHHEASECVKLTSELETLPTAKDARIIMDVALYWSRFSENSETSRELRKMLNAYPTKIICASHANVITEPDVLLRLMEEALLAQSAA